MKLMFDQNILFIFFSSFKIYQILHLLWLFYHNKLSSYAEVPLISSLASTEKKCDAFSSVEVFSSSSLESEV